MDREELLKLIGTKKIVGIDLSGEKLEKIDFSGCTLERVNFKGCEMVHCRFRNAKIMWSDFRYAEIQHGTFEGAQIDFWLTGILMEQVKGQMTLMSNLNGTHRLQLMQDGLMQRSSTRISMLCGPERVILQMATGRMYRERGWSGCV